MKNAIHYVLLCLSLSFSCLFGQGTSSLPEFAEFANRTTVKFSSKDHPKADGLIITLERPSTWIAEDGSRPHVVQKFTSRKESYGVTASLMVRSLPNGSGGFATGDQILASLEPDELKKGLVPGMELLSCNPIKIDGLPGKVCTYMYRTNAAGAEIYSVMVDYAFVFESKLINLSFMIGTPNLDEVALLPKHLEEFSPVFFQMANSIVVENRWK